MTFDCCQEVKDSGVSVHSFEELLSIGATKPAEPVPPSADDLCTIMYTSGTTGVAFICQFWMLYRTESCCCSYASSLAASKLCLNSSMHFYLVC